MSDLQYMLVVVGVASTGYYAILWLGFKVIGWLAPSAMSRR